MVIVHIFGQNTLNSTGTAPVHETPSPGAKLVQSHVHSEWSKRLVQKLLRW